MVKILNLVVFECTRYCIANKVTQLHFPTELKQTSVVRRKLVSPKWIYFGYKLLFSTSENILFYWSITIFAPFSLYKLCQNNLYIFHSTLSSQINFWHLILGHYFSNPIRKIQAIISQQHVVVKMCFPAEKKLLLETTRAENVFGVYKLIECSSR